MDDETMRRLDYAFEAIDSDCDGMIVASDFPEIVARFPLSKDDPRVRGARSFYELYYKELVRHNGRDQEYWNKPDFFIAHSKRATGTSQEEALLSGADSIFQSVAAFGDGDVSKNALVRFLDQVWEIRRGRAEHIFAELDKDGDGHLSKEEFDEAAKQYLFSTKYNAVGALLFREVDS